MRIAAAYVRVSDERQEEFSPDSQIKRLRDYAEKNGMIIPDELIFRDDGISGKKADKRPGFTEMIAIAKLKEKPFDAILVWKFSRFARNQEESIVYKSLLRKNGVDVISVSETLDDNPFSGLIERIIEWMDEYYLIRLSDEVRRGMTERATRGLPNNAPPYGYTMKKGENYEIVEEEAEVVRKIFSLYLQGWPMKKIANYTRDLGVKNHYGNSIDNRGVEYILNNPVYAGWLRWNPHGRSSSARKYNSPDDILRKGTHIPIIDEETFEETKKRLADQKKNARRYERKSPVKEEFMLRGIVKCNTCGSTLVFNKSSNGLQCHNYSRGRCPTSHFINIDMLNEMVLQQMKDNVAEMSFNTASPAVVIETGDVNYDALIKSQLLKLERAKQAYQSGVDSLEEYKQTKAKIDAEIKRLQNEAANAATVNSGESIEDFAKTVDGAIRLLEDPELSGAFKNEIIKTFVDYIIFYKPERTIRIFYKM